MAHPSDKFAPASVPARKVARDEVRARAPNAKRHFQSPEMLVADAGLSDADKLALLKDWDLELSNRLKAEEEGMSASDPIGEGREARLADEAARVKTLLLELSGRVGETG
jgi:hypothetical protein